MPSTMCLESFHNSCNDSTTKTNPTATLPTSLSTATNADSIVMNNVSTTS